MGDYGYQLPVLGRYQLYVKALALITAVHTSHQYSRQKYIFILSRALCQKSDTTANHSIMSCSDKHSTPLTQTRLLLSQKRCRSGNSSTQTLQSYS